jgi:uncharacterized delta-60 repeat protein
MSNSLTFIDTKLSDYQSIIDSIPSTDTYYLINSDSDGLTQMASILSGYSSLDAIHVFSHGSIGSLNLGSTIINQENIASYQSQLQAIGSSLTAKGDILLYGCNVAQGDTGASFISILASYTGADVAASTDITGSSALGGDWELEATAGAIESPTVEATAYDGTLKINTAPTFTVGNGKVTTDFGADEEAYSVAIQNDGKIVVAGSGSLIRYNSNGTLDTTFDGDGIATTGTTIYSITIQTDGKIVVAGVDSGNLALARYNSNGTLDTTFDGDGKVTTDITSQYDMADSVTIQNDGKIVVAGTANGDFALARYNSDGSLDTTFSGDGKVTTPIYNSNGYYHYGLPKGITTQADGKIVVVGSAYAPDTQYYYNALARYNNDGTLDTTFSGDGTIAGWPRYGSLYSVAIQTDGKIVVASGELIRYNSDGTLDTTFDGDGIATTGTTIYSITIQTEGVVK